MAASPQHVTLVANTVTTLTFDADFNTVEVVNRDGAAEFYFTVNGAAPTVGGVGCEVVTAGGGAFTQANVSGAGNTVVQLISAGTPKVSVRAW